MLVYFIEGNVFDALGCVFPAIIFGRVYLAPMLAVCALLMAPALYYIASGTEVFIAFTSAANFTFWAIRGREILLATHVLVFLRSIRLHGGRPPQAKPGTTVLARFREDIVFGQFLYVVLCAFALPMQGMSWHNGAVWVSTTVALVVLAWRAPRDNNGASTARQLMTVSGLLRAFGVAQICAGVVVCAGLAAGVALGLKGANGVVECTAALLFVMLGAFTYAAGLRVHAWRRAAMIAALLQLGLFPFGTVIGLYTLLILTRRELRVRYDGRKTGERITPMPRRARPAAYFVWAAVCVVAAPPMWVNLYSVVNPPVTSVMIQRHAEGADVRATWVSVDEVGKNWESCIVAREDPSFYRHNGFNWYRMRKAWDAFSSGERVPGSSTITQQVAKNCFLWPERTLVRKAIEQYFAACIETSWTKQRTITVYLNICEMANGVFGVEAASRTFFGKPAHALTLGEIDAIAAGMPYAKRIDPADPMRDMPNEQRRAMRRAIRKAATGQ